MLPLLWLLFYIQITNGISIPTTELLNGNQIPIIGFGTSTIDKEKIESSIGTALANGYRHIDTAFIYGNEKLIGNALKTYFDNGGKRQELFITSKLPSLAMRPADIEEVLNISLNSLGIDYLDMYLIHAPIAFKRTVDFGFVKHKNGSVIIDPTTDFVAVWKKLEEQVRAGKIKSIGLSNFNETQIMRIWENAQIKPTNLQVESNIYIQQNKLHDLCKKLGIVMTGYSPLGSGNRRTKIEHELNLVSPIQHPTVIKIAQAHNKSTAQILLRFNIQRNIVVIPKSENPDRIKENINIFDFKLTTDQMSELKTLDQHGKYRKFNLISTFDGIQYHPEYPFPDSL